MIIDTHAHLYDSDFDSDLDLVVERAKKIGVEKCILPSIDSTYYDSMMRCTDSLKGFAFPAIGLHPTSVRGNYRQELLFVKEKVKEGGFCAIGEIGMDGYWSKDLFYEQKEALSEQLLMAIEYDLPVIIHSRDATEEIFDVLNSIKKQNIGTLKGVFHAFAGSYELYKRILSYGEFKFGIGGVVTYKNAGIASTLKEIPLSDILLETDSPWLSPVPYRGKRNESSYLCHIIEKIASIKGVSTEEVEQITTKNSMELFKLN